MKYNKYINGGKNWVFKKNNNLVMFLNYNHKIK